MTKDGSIFHTLRNLILPHNPEEPPDTDSYQGTSSNSPEFESETPFDFLIPQTSIKAIA